jgi:hypothetical protein
MQLTPDLDRSVLEAGSFRRARKLPFIGDILDRLYNATDADYLIYTNVDIALMPHFYLAVDRLIDCGYDAFTITRRTIPSTHRTEEQIPLMYAQVGEPHPGHDCFVFRRDVYPDYYLGEACIGASEVGKLLNLNLICHATKFGEFKDLHLTFHLGDDRIWQSPDLCDYSEHNRKVLVRGLEHFQAIRDLPDHTLVNQYRNEANAIEVSLVQRLTWPIDWLVARVHMLARILRDARRH